MVLKSIGVLSCGKLLAFIYAILGLFVGGVFALISLAGFALPQPQNGEHVPIAFFMFMGVASVVVLPILYGVSGFVFGVVMAAIYNVVAGVVGGLELKFETTMDDDRYPA